MANEANHNDRRERLHAIFDAAISLASAEERQRYVVEVCGSDPDLRRQVESLLRAHDQADQFLDQSVTGATLDPIAEDPGTIIGRYRLLEELGQGGFGVVYRAEQLEPVRREVALKIIKEGMDTQEVIARFEVERQALALMDHPNIAHVHDAGATATGRPYFVMELVGGLPVHLGHPGGQRGSTGRGWFGAVFPLAGHRDGDRLGQRRRGQFREELPIRSFQATIIVGAHQQLGLGPLVAPPQVE